MANSSMAMIAMMAFVSPEDFLVDRLDEKVKEFLEAKLLGKSEEELQKIFKDLAPYCMMILTKIQGDDPMKMMDDIDKIEKARNLIEPHNS